MALGNTLIDYGSAQTRAIVRVIQSGTVNTSWAALFNVTYNGTEYSLGDSFTVNIGDTITINMNRKHGYTFNQIYVNGSVVVNQGNAVVSYDYTVQKSTDVTYQEAQSGTETYLRAYITDSDVVAGFERKITEGKTLVNGAAYSIKQGKTLANGVAYDIGGSSKTTSVEITGVGGRTWCYCIINGTTYTSAATDIEVQWGDIVTLYVRSDTTASMASITINDVAVWRGYNQAKAYEWLVPNEITSAVINLSFYSSGLRYHYGIITVTTT